MNRESICCPICKSEKNETILFAKDFRFKISADSFRVAKCKQCAFIFINPRPPEIIINKFYPQDFNMRQNTPLFKVIEPCFKRTQNSTIKLIKKYKNKGRVLDIGCGNADFLLAMQENGYDVYGVESNKGAEKFSSKDLKGRILYKELEQCGFDSKSFDIVTMFQSLEHIYNLDNLFREINRIMKDGAILFISVPNARFFEYRLFGPYAYTLEVPRHLYFFTRDALRNLLVKKGFTIDRFRRDIIGELSLTPASVYHGVWNYLQDKPGIRIEILHSLSFVPLVILGFFLHLTFIGEGHILQVICRKNV